MDSWTCGKALKLIQIDFDNLENLNGIRQKVHGIFVSEKEKSCMEKIDEFLKTLPPYEMYQGWNGGIYPQFKAVDVTNCIY